MLNKIILVLALSYLAGAIWRLERCLSVCACSAPASESESL